jgi:hypothetical protein
VRAIQAAAVKYLTRYGNSTDEADADANAAARLAAQHATKLLARNVLKS